MEENSVEKEIPQRDLVYAIVGSAFEVVNGLGNGLHEKPYENALAVEFGLRGIAFEQQPRFPIDYKGTNVGDYIPDLVAARAVIVDAKVIDHISDTERGKMLNYLRVTKLQVGLIMNFKNARLEWERLVL